MLDLLWSRIGRNLNVYHQANHHLETTQNTVSECSWKCWYHIHVTRNMPSQSHRIESCIHMENTSNSTSKQNCDEDVGNQRTKILQKEKTHGYRKEHHNDVSELEHYGQDFKALVVLRLIYTESRACCLIVHHHFSNKKGTKNRCKLEKHRNISGFILKSFYEKVAWVPKQKRWVQNFNATWSDHEQSEVPCF